MTIEEKLDDLHDKVQRLLETSNAAADRENREFTAIDHRLSRIEEAVNSLGTVVRTFSMDQGVRPDGLKGHRRPQRRGFALVIASAPSAVHWLAEAIRGQLVRKGTGVCNAPEAAVNMCPPV